MSGRRMVLLLVLLPAIGIPAGVLSATCAIGSCEDARVRMFKGHTGDASPSQ